VAHSQAMGINLFKIVDFPAVICVASMIALLVGSVAHYPFGVSVRASALVGAGVFALIFALLVATQWGDIRPRLNRVGHKKVG
jgi:hypothetical protein